MNTLLRSLSLLLLLLTAGSLHAAVLKGVVLTRNDEPVAYAYLYVDNKCYATQADENGYFELQIPQGSYQLTATCVGFIPNTTTVSTGDSVWRIYLKNNNLLDAVTITATRSPKTIANTPVVTRIITSHDIEKIDATNIRELLEAELPGIEFSYSMNQQVSVNLQGMGGMSVLFLVDGERLAGETLNNIDFARLNMDNIERIEIIKGAATALYGSNAVGAVINIITKTPNEPWTAQVNGRWGSRYGQYRYGGHAGFNKGRVSNLINVQTDGFDSYKLYDKDGDSTLVYGNHQWNIKDKLVFKLNEKEQITARGGFYFHQREVSEIDKERARDFSGGLRYEKQLNDFDRLEVNYGYDRYDKSDFYPLIDKEFLDYKNVQHTLRALYSHTFNENINMAVGGDMMNDYLMSYQFAAHQNNHQQQTADLFAQADWEPSIHWELVGGLRADYFSHYGIELTPKLAAMYKLGDFRLRGSYAKGFRAPTLKEMFMDFNMANVFTIYGNESLESEVSHCFSLSGEYLRQHFSATLTGYYNRVNNQITTVWDPQLGGMVYQNVGGMHAATIDATVVLRTDCGLGGKLCYTFFHEFPLEEYNLSDTRPHSVVLQADYHKAFKHYDLFLMINGRMLSASDYYVVSSSDGVAYDTYAPFHSVGYTLWKVSIMQRFRNAATISLSIDNLFNYKPKEYEYNMPYTLGTTILLGCSIDLHRILPQLYDR